ncbi:hypothetical protein D6D19_07601 [Aureobasidium pullulans]|uniref:Uncharacterized protein n=1 Tax=Aureobasidium pullulans TaxID=5580 RepID=A0A4S8ZWT2_AURPU|nr:hypothetical protein D6D19_07601 [Aureobasidium pullulans]
MTCYFGQQSCALLRTSRYCSSAGFVVESSLAIQKSLTSSLKQDLKFTVRLHEDITRWKGEEKDAGERIAYLESYLRDLQDVEVKMEVLSAHMKG